MANIGRMVKESIVEELTSELSERPNFFVTTINRLAAPDADTFRQKLFGANAKLVMVKRRVGQRAIDQLKLAGVTDLFEGSVGVILTGDDVLPTAKLIVEFRKAHEEQMALQGAVVDGQLLDRSRVEQLASLPSKPVLLAQVLGTIEAPMADVIFTVERLIGDLAWIAEQAAGTKLAAPAAAGATTPDAPVAAPDAGTAPAQPTS